MRTSRSKLICEKIYKQEKEWIRIIVERSWERDTAVCTEKGYLNRFSRQKTGKWGTGLGLSISYGIIKEHKGDLGV